MEILLLAAIIVIVILSYKIRSLIHERDVALKKQESDSKILFLQSRYASMGETVGNIAHQWKQPLNAIGSIQNSIKASLIFQGEISKEKLLNSVDTSFKLLQHLAETIDTFYSFLSYKESSSFVLSDELEKIRKITEYSFENSNITLQYELNINPTIQGNANEFTHSMLNLILNAKDAFDESDSHSPTIIVRVDDGNGNCNITVCDNAGGIRIMPIEMVFDRHISTKESGSGLGLFMTKNIIENRFSGTICVENKSGGACFTIALPYAQYNENFPLLETTDEKLSLERINQLSRKVIELEEIEKTLKKWAEIFEHAHWAITIRLANSNTLEMTNPAFNALYGYTTNEINTLSVPDLFAPQSLEILPKIQKEAFEKGFTVFETIQKRKDGSYFPASVELIVIKDAQGEVLYNVANIWDLTEKKEVEERLKLKKFALEHIQEAVYLIDKDSKVHYVNEKAYTSLGYTQEELLSMTTLDLNSDLTMELWNAHWEDIRKNGSAKALIEHKRKDGVVIPVEVSANYFEYNGVGYNLAISRDITERLLLEAEKETRALKTIAENIPDNIARWDTEGRYLYINPTHERTLGISNSEIIGMSISDEHTEVKEAIAEVITAKQKVIVHQQVLNENGEREMHDVTLVPELDTDGKLISVLGIGKDMTDIYRMQDTISAREKEFRTLVENLPDNVIRYDKECRAIYVTPHMDKLHGEDTALTLLSKTPTEVHSDFVETREYQEKIVRTIATGETNELELTFPIHTGEIRTHHIRFIAERDLNGEIYGALAIGTDITERKMHENLLVQKEQESRALLNNLPGYVYTLKLSPEGEMNFIYLSPGVAEVYGINAEEPLDDMVATIHEMIHHDDLQEIEAKIIQSSQELTPFFVAYRIHHPTDGEKWLEARSIPEKLQDGTIVWHGIVLDVTKRKKLEALLDKERKFLTDAQRVAHTGSWYLDIKDGVLTWSDETYRIFEFDKEDIDDLHKTFYECVHPDDREMVNAPYLETLKTGNAYEIEHRIVMADGRIKYVIERCAHTYDNDGTPLYSIGTVQDITARKEEEEIMQQNRTLLHAILESSPDVITFALDTNYRYIAFDSKHAEVMRTIFGKEITIGMDMLEVIGSIADRKIAKRSYDRALEGESFIAEEEYGDERLSRKFWQISYSPICSNEGKIIGLTCFNLDITQRKQAEEYIHNLNMTLEKRIHERTVQLQEAVTTLHQEVTERKNTEKQLKLIETAINSSDEAVYIIDDTNRIIFASDAVSTMLGYTKEELMEMTIYDIDVHLSYEDVCKIFENLPVEYRFTFKTKHRTKEGRIFDVEVNTTCFTHQGIGFGISIIKEIGGKDS